MSELEQLKKEIEYLKEIIKLKDRVSILQDEIVILTKTQRVENNPYMRITQEPPRQVIKQDPDFYKSKRPFLYDYGPTCTLKSTHPSILDSLGKEFESYTNKDSINIPSYWNKNGN